MTNKEAVKRIQDIITYTGLTIPTSLNDIEALEMAIKALEEERPQDNITEEDIKNAIKAGYENGYSMAQAKYQRPQGEWIKVKPFLHKCSVCGRKLKDVFDDELLSDYPFCHCGADMRGEEK